MDLRRKKTAEEISAEQDRQYQKANETYNRNDIKTANRIWFDLASKGHILAQRNLENLHLDEGNNDLAFKYLSLATKKNDDSYAALSLAKLYSTQDFLYSDLEKAYQLFEILANRSIQEAIEKVIQCRLDGIGTNINFEIANDWVQYGIDQGYENLKKYMVKSKEKEAEIQPFLHFKLDDFGQKTTLCKDLKKDDCISFQHQRYQIIQVPLALPFLRGRTRIFLTVKNCCTNKINRLSMDNNDYLKQFSIS